MVQKSGSSDAVTVSVHRGRGIGREERGRRTKVPTPAISLIVKLPKEAVSGAREVRVSAYFC